jgi:hypothetical protein
MLDVTDLTIKVQKKCNFVLSFVVYLTSNTKYMSSDVWVIINDGLEMMLKIGRSILWVTVPTFVCLDWIWKTIKTLSG